MAKQKIDSNVVGLSYAEESALATLPGSPKWRPLDPNEFSDFGGEVTKIRREPINASRQKKKGLVTDLEATAGFGQDVTQSNLQRLLQGFVFADAHERPSTDPISGAAANTVVLQDVAAGNDLDVGAGEGAKFEVGMILKTSGFANTANNVDEAVITAIVADALTTDAVFVVETVTDQKLEVVGYEFGTGIASLDVSGATVTLERSSGDFADLNLNVGEWIFIGGDTAINAFDNNGPGYARIVSISATALVLDECTWTPITEAAAGKEIRIYLGTFLRNESTAALIKRRTFQLERTLGQDANGVQSEYVIGAVANEFTLNVPSTDKVTADLAFVGTDVEFRDGTEGVKGGDRVDLLLEEAFNTSTDIYQSRLYIHNTAKNTPDALFGHAQELTITINNGITGLKAVGTLGSFDLNAGDFEVGGEIQAYFTEVAAISAVRNNADIGFNLIAAVDNTGFIYDIPLLSISGGRAEVAKDEPILLPLEKMAAENENGYTLACTFFSFLPDGAMGS